MAKFVELALAALQFQTEGLLEIADILFATPAKARRQFSQPLTYEWGWFKKSWADLYRNRQQFHRTLSHLKKQGLISKDKGESMSYWVLTRRGKERYAQQRKSRRDPFLASNSVFVKSQGSGITMIAYDIPEKERRKRTWVRLCLAAMECTQIQKSVWMAKGSIDENFIRALRERDLLGNVHIFGVTKQGTIKQIKE